jgi:hypothetical protein
MNANRSSVDRSAQWRSSMARTTGRSWPSVSRVDRTASNSRDWLAGSSPCETRPPSVWGNNRDSSLRGPVSNALTRSAPSSRVSPRSASTTGAYGSAASPRSRHPPPTARPRPGPWRGTPSAGGSCRSPRRRRPTRSTVHRRPPARARPRAGNVQHGGRRRWGTSSGRACRQLGTSGGVRDPARRDHAPRKVVSAVHACTRDDRRPEEMA